jgi:hypothetical protein
MLFRSPSLATAVSLAPQFLLLANMTIIIIIIVVLVVVNGSTR